MGKALRYQNRLKTLNKDRERRSVWDSIDRPIRPLVYELNRIGLQTKFSCCGFPYDGEEEPKSHAQNKAYVHIFSPRDERSMKNFFKLVDIAKRHGWTMYYFTNGIWDLGFINRMGSFYNRNDGVSTAIHDYEPMVLAIYELTEAIKNHFQDSFDFKIVDGNSHYTKYEEWQVKPKEDHLVVLEQ